MMSSTIEELADTLSHYDRDIKKLRTKGRSFLRPLLMGTVISLSEGIKDMKTTHVCHEPTVGNSVQMTAILRKCRLQ